MTQGLRRPQQQSPADQTSYTTRPRYNYLSNVLTDLPATHLTTACQRTYQVYGDGSSNKMHGGITIDVVHRTHLRIFREYYPPQLDNWCVPTPTLSPNPSPQP